MPPTKHPSCPWFSSLHSQISQILKVMSLLFFHSSFLLKTQIVHTGGKILWIKLECDESDVYIEREREGGEIRSVEKTN